MRLLRRRELPGTLAPELGKTTTPSKGYALDDEAAARAWLDQAAAQAGWLYEQDNPSGKDWGPKPAGTRVQVSEAWLSEDAAVSGG